MVRQPAAPAFLWQEDLAVYICDLYSKAVGCSRPIVPLFFASAFYSIVRQGSQAYSLAPVETSWAKVTWASNKDFVLALAKFFWSVVTVLKTSLSSDVTSKGCRYVVDRLISGLALPPGMTWTLAIGSPKLQQAAALAKTMLDRSLPWACPRRRARSSQVPRPDS